MSKTRKIPVRPQHCIGCHPLTREHALAEQAALRLDVYDSCWVCATKGPSEVVSDAS